LLANPNTRSQLTDERSKGVPAQRAVSNVTFDVADVYALPFDDGSFQAVFAKVLQLHLYTCVHLRERARAMREMRRVLRPSGVAAVRDLDWGAWPMARAHRCWSSSGTS
jgi:ubiquinone/menaquinone biosynthesis C-methylase UbiE